jgi:Nif-specific regulatory protein
VAQDDLERARKERDLYLSLLELGAEDDVRALLERALALVVSATGAEQGYIELYGASGPRATIAKNLADDEVSRVKRALSTGIVEEALRSGQTVSTASALDDPKYQGFESVQAQRIRAVLCAPLSLRSARGPTSSIGVLYLAGRTAPGPFPEADRALADTVARHLGPVADRLLSLEEPTLADATLDLRSRVRVDGIAGRSRALAEVFRQILVAAAVPVTVLVRGESGTGKSQVARALHDSSPRASGPFVELNAGAIPETLFESELFGAEKGAHSTATARILGKIDAARGGTLFLDEVGEIPLPAQSKLLTFLQSKRYYRLGSTTPLEADVRIVAATNRDLEEAVRDKTFREDLYYRLNVLDVVVPPLRERREDIGAIAETIVERLGAEGGGSVGVAKLALTRAAKAALAEADWPGNVRQLENVLSRGWAVALSERSATIDVAHLFPDRPPAQAADDASAPLTYQEATRRFQAGLVRETLEACRWNVSEAARRLDLARSHMNDLIKVHGLTRADKATKSDRSEGPR